MSDITLLLDSVARGDARAAEEVLPVVYSELRRLAAHKMAGESAGHTLQATALVHEAWLSPSCISTAESPSGTILGFIYI